MQPEKASKPMSVTDKGIVTEVRPVQSIKAERPMVATAAPMVKEERLEQPENASDSMTVHWSGMTSSPERLLHPEKAASGMTLRFSGITTLVSPVQR